MSEYIITVDEVKADFEGNIPISAKQEVVRCRDCKHYNDQEPGGEIGTCNLGLEELDLLSIVEPDGFCAWAERRQP